MPDVLFLTPRLPYPPDKGEKIRSFHILQYLARSFDIYLGCLIDDAGDKVHIKAVRAMCHDAHIATLNPRFVLARCLRGLLRGEALSVSFFRDHRLARWVRYVVEKIQPALIFVSSSSMAPYVLDLPITGSRIVDLVDVDSEKWRTYAGIARGLMRPIYQRECRRVAALERRIAHECDLSSFVSDAEAVLFARQLPDCAARIRGVSNGVDHHYFDPNREHAAVYDPNLPTYVFTGTMDYKPNVDAVTWFVTEILPAIRRTLPAARFYIVGNHPTANVRALAAAGAVFVTGHVSDIRPYIAHATASVAPMRVAHGIQNKVLEAMSLGKPVILTNRALEGIDAEPGREVILADTAKDFAAACCRLAAYGDREGIGAAARRLVLRNFDWSVTLRGFDDLLPLTKPTPFAHGDQRRDLSSENGTCGE